MVVKRNLNTEKKVSKRQSRKVPFVLSTSMLAATFLVAGASVSADEHNGQDVNHGEIVSEVAQALPGSPEKGQIMSSIAQGDYELAKEILSDFIDDSDDLEEKDFEDLIPEEAVEDEATEEATEEEAVEDEATEEEAVEDEATEEEAVEDEATEEDAVEDEAVEDEATEEDALEETEQQLDAQYDEIVEEITERYQSIFDRNETLLDYQDLYIEDQLVAMGVIDAKDDAEAIEEEIALIADDVEENLEEDADGNSQDIQAEGNSEVQADAEAEVGTNENDAVESDGTTDENASVAVIEADADVDTEANADIQADEEAESDELLEDVNDQENSSTFKPYQQLTNAYEKVKTSYANFISLLK